MTVADNLLTLQAEEDRIRSISLAHIRQHEDLGLQADAIEAAMSVIEHFTAGWLTADLDELTIQHLGIRLFNAAASAWRLLLCGYYQNSTAQLRDLLETAFLLDYLGTAPGLVATWRDARSAADRDQFRPVKIRESLDTRDGFKERKRADHYRLLSTYASHPNPLGFAMLRPAGTTLAKVGPFFDESALKAVLEEAGMPLFEVGSAHKKIKSRLQRELSQADFTDARYRKWCSLDVAKLDALIGSERDRAGKLDEKAIKITIVLAISLTIGSTFAKSIVDGVAEPALKPYVQGGLLLSMIYIMVGGFWALLSGSSAKAQSGYGPDWEVEIADAKDEPKQPRVTNQSVI